jgi:hypothetical protein
MKKVIFENGLKAFLATAFLLVLGVGTAMAQGKLTSVATVPGVSNPPAPSSPVYNVPTGTFVNQIVAGQKLDYELEIMKGQLNDLMFGSQPDPVMAATVMVKYRYYAAINAHIKSGATTANAISAGLWIFLESLEFSHVTTAQQNALKQQAIDLLLA